MIAPPLVFSAGTACLRVAATPRTLIASTLSHSARSESLGLTPTRYNPGIRDDNIQSA